MTEKPKKFNRGWLKDPKKARDGETIGGGFWVFRRGDDTGRIRPALWPFEYGTYDEAFSQASRLAEAHRGYEFIVVQQAAGVLMGKTKEEGVAA